MNPGLMGLVGAPTYPMLRDATQRTLFEILDVEEIGYVYHKQENKITLDENGSSIIFRTLDNPDRLRGPNLAWFGVDELTYCKWSAWEKLEGRLRDPRANRLCGFAAWTPNGFDNVYESFISKPKPGYRAVLASPRENFHVAKSGFYDRLESSYDEKLYRQEVLGEYLNIRAGRSYYAFDRNLNVAPQVYDPAVPICWSLDFNVNPMCSVIGQMQEIRDYDRVLRRRFNVLDEINLPDSNTPQACETFWARVEPWSRNRQLIVNIYGDATGTKRTSASVGSPSDWGAVRDFMSRMGSSIRYSAKYRSANPFQKDRVAAVNAALRNSQGERSLYIDPKCTTLIRDLERVTWKQGAAVLDQDTDPMLTHMSDALGYWIDVEASVSRQSGGPRGSYVA